MKVNAFVAAGLGSLILASAASADFLTNPDGTGLLSFEVKGTASVAGDIGFWAVNVYADFSAADDRLLSIIQAEYGVDTDSGPLYMNALGSGLEPNPALFAFDPDLEWSSFVTIGHKTIVAGEPTTSFDPDGEWTGGLAAPVFTGGYFVPGDAPQGLAGPGLKVLIAQLTIQNPTADAAVTGTATVAWKAAGGETSFTEIDFVYPIPAPGALALLGLAGLAGTRRRR